MKNQKNTELKGGKIVEVKIKKSENLNEDIKKEGKMAYYCKLCQCWHYHGSAIFLAHKIYASQRTSPKKVVRRTKRKSFWDRW